MVGTFKHIAVFMDGSPQSEALGRHAAELARASDAHLVGIFGVSKDEELRRADGFARGEKAIDAVIRRQREEAAALALAAGRQFAEIVRDHGVSSEFRIIWGDNESEDILRRLHADLIITSQPKPPHLPAGWSAEHLLRQSGSPVLLIPTARPGELLEPHIVIAWNGSAKARRAVNDALPLLRMASRVTVLIVDAQRHPEIHGEDPGRDVVDHLARHGILALTHCVAAEGHPVSEVIATEADGLDADLVVIGAYSRSRATEMIFGGVTRALLAKAPRPLFISN